MSVVLLLALSAHAADVDPFRPAGSLASGQGSLQGESPYLLGEGLSAGVFASFAQDLAVADFGGRTEPLVRSALPMEVYGGWTVEDRVRFEVFLPVYAWVDAPVSGFQGTAMGDLRLQANVPLWKRDSVRLGIVPRAELPTGSTDAFTKRGFQLGVTAALAGEVGRFGWVGNGGIAVSEKSEFLGVGTGSAVELLGGAFYRVTPGFRLGAEAETQLGLVSAADGSNVLGTGHLFGQTSLPSGLSMTVGAGTGLIAGVGAPDYRMFAALTYGRTVSDRDGDGILDRDDRCPLEPEDLDGFRDTDGCPDPDNDNDTFVDTRDACPDRPEDFDGFEDEDGCPEADNDADGVLDADDLCPDVWGLESLSGCPDRDGDGLADAQDECPDEPGPIERNGCPDRDRDGDGVPDDRDACPDDPIDAGEDPATSDGCPKLAIVKGTQISIGQRVEFRTGSAEIDAKSFALLNAVAQLLERRTEIRKVEVAGHTDNVGSETYNQKLSQQRSESVLTYLVGAGVARNRLTFKGYGETTPMTTNRTPEGRATNRRVEFNILVQDAPEKVVVPKPPSPRPDPEPVAPKPAPVAPKPAPVAPKPAPVAPKPAPEPKPAFDPGTNDLENPWGTVLAPAPAPSPVAAPAPAPAPRPAPVIEPAENDLENPWGASVQPAPKPTAVQPAPKSESASGSADPAGKPGRLTIYLRGIESAEVWLDNERLPRAAPFERLPVAAGEHKVWVSDKASGLDFESTIVVQNEREQILVLPPGGVTPPAAPTDEPGALIPENPTPKPAPSREGRRSKKRRK
ncbi:MAG: OmpA family protein [Myxococcota bacterium]